MADAEDAHWTPEALRECDAQLQEAREAQGAICITVIMAYTAGVLSFLALWAIAWAVR